jgi:lipid-A-disaccharide synthase
MTTEPASVPAPSRAHGLIVAGEASGDRHGAALVTALRSELPVDWFGIGGDELADAGVELITHARALSILGVFEVLHHIPRVYGILRHLTGEAERRQPRFAVLIDSPDFNLPLARRLYQRRIPVIYFIAPQVWAWRRSRLRLLRRYVERLICILPFEEEFFRSAGLDVTYVGHPLVDLARASLPREEFLRRHQLDPERRTVALLPGSRPQEVRRHLPTLLEAAHQLASADRVQFILQRASTVDLDLLNRLLAPFSHLPLAVSQGTPYNALGAAEVALVASGTITVEALLMQTPMIVFYRVSPPSWWVGQWLVRVPHYSMVNLIAGERLVPELIQDQFTPTRLAAEASRLLRDDQERLRIQQELGHLKQRLGPPGAIGRAARAVLETLETPAQKGSRP